MPTPPGRLGIREPLLAPYTAAGWVAEGLLVDPAAALLTEIARGPDPGGARSRLAGLFSADPAMAADLLDDPALGAAAVAIVGASRTLSEVAAANPQALRDAARGIISDVEAPDPGDGLPEAIIALRTGVRAALLGIAVGDLVGSLSMPEVGAALSETADAAAKAALTAAFQIVGADVTLALIAMGKWGGRELNYASDIDVLFVYEGGDEAGATARRVAETFISLLDGQGNGAFRVDADLRPEGRGGPLARSLASYQAYWDRWAETWEMQALLKARPVAGDPDLGAAFLSAAEPFVFPETLGAEAVREIRAMKARTEQISGADGDVEIKRGVGGIRDVEFAVQLLQLVHGRSDPALRGANTLQALAVLGEGGYVRPEDAAELADAYHWLRNVEHRLQLFGLRQTHSLPADPSRHERLAKAMGYRDGADGTAAADFDRALIGRRAAVRTIHERLFYRPLLEAFAASPAVRLTEEGAARQLAALGYADTAAARRAFGDLTGGLSRRSGLMQQMLPLMLDWLSQAPDPDLGLSQLRLLVTTTSDNAALIAALRDNPVIAERLCALLGTSRLLGRLVDRIPASLTRLGDDAGGAFPDPAALASEAVRLVTVRADHDERIAALRRFAQERLLWTAGADLMGAADHKSVGHRLTAVGDALTAAALQMATAEATRAGDAAPPIAVIGMGKWGGRELNYASDLDALLVHAPGDERATAAALEVAERFVAIVDAVAADGPGRGIDLGLRPEGKRGPLIRSLDSYRAYYERWAETWEFQALLRARPIAGDPELAAAFMEMTAPLAHRGDFGERETAEVRAMKARIESERIPAGDDPDFHMKLGKGGMADVEWTAQLLQLRHTFEDPSLRTPSTLAALATLADAGHLDAEDGAVLSAAYAFCATIRNRLYLQAGRARDSLPSDPLEVTRLARSLGYEHDPRASLREEYRRTTRRARRAVDRIFYEVPVRRRRKPSS